MFNIKNAINSKLNKNKWIRVGTSAASKVAVKKMQLKSERFGFVTRTGSVLCVLVCFLYYIAIHHSNMLQSQLYFLRCGGAVGVACLAIGHVACRGAAERQLVAIMHDERRDFCWRIDCTTTEVTCVTFRLHRRVLVLVLVVVVGFGVALHMPCAGLLCI
jgi:hypothetical protein